ncbi:MAG TPA: alpha/beta fold hydrolase [Streptosporangiaceae bacterium]|nr:alpha/beta fold hydrolase [Streptosporangiaceae bacterium]
MITKAGVPSAAWARKYSGCPGPVALRLLCFPHAGGGASLFRNWRLPDDLPAEVWAVQLPGRENRRAEEPFRRIEPLLAALIDALRPLMDRPVAFFGHSMGALIAFEFSRELRRTGRPLPVRLFLSARRSPELAPRHPQASRLPDPEFFARLDRVAGGSAAAGRDPELIRLLAPLIRTDFGLCEHYRHRDEPPLPIPFTCFSATEDTEVSPADVAGWERHSSASWRHCVYPGGHFFIRDHEQSVLADIAADLRLGLPDG